MNDLKSIFLLNFEDFTMCLRYIYCIVLYCIMRPYTEGRLDRYHIGIPRENPKSALNLG